MQNKTIVNIFLRYFVLLLLAINNLYVFYFIFTFLTIYPVLFLLNILYNPILSGTNIIIGTHTIELIGACIAGSAYYLLLILNLTVKMPVKKRIYSLIYSLGLLWIINILRIFILSILFVENFTYFDLTHKFFWYFMSIVFVIAIWFSEVKIFKIKDIPVYTDLKALTSKTK